MHFCFMVAKAYWRVYVPGAQTSRTWLQGIEGRNRGAKNLLARPNSGKDAAPKPEREKTTSQVVAPEISERLALEEGGRLRATGRGRWHLSLDGPQGFLEAQPLSQRWGLGSGAGSFPPPPSPASSFGPRPFPGSGPPAPSAQRLYAVGPTAPSQVPTVSAGEKSGQAVTTAAGAPERTLARRARLRVLTGPPGRRLGPPLPPSPQSPPQLPGGRTRRWDPAGSSVGRGEGGLVPGRGRASTRGLAGRWALTGPGAPGPAGRTAAVSAAAGCGEGRGERGCEQASEQAKGGRGAGWWGRRESAGRGRGLARLPPSAGVCLFSRWVAALTLDRGSPVT
ncbi:uncharacterized protein LOC120889777 [Ictidomys tridecemlineatus]